MMNMKTEMICRLPGAALLLSLALTSTVALAETDRITVEDPATSIVKFKVTSDGNVTGTSYTGTVFTGSALGVGVAAPDRPVVVDTSSNTLNAGNSSIILQGESNKERMEIRSFGSAGLFAPTFMGLGARGTKAAPLPVSSGDILFLLSGFGWNGTAFGGINPASNSGAASVIMNASETHSVTAKGSYIDFQTTANGTTARTTRLRVGNDGSVGIGTTAPSQRLEVNGGVRLNTAASKPSCSSAVRGTFWLTQMGTGTMDTLEVCVKDSTEAYIWKAVW
jgi:hypothetical protein